MRCAVGPRAAGLRAGHARPDLQTVPRSEARRGARSQTGSQEVAQEAVTPHALTVTRHSSQEFRLHSSLRLHFSHSAPLPSSLSVIYTLLAVPFKIKSSIFLWIF